MPAFPGQQLYLPNQQPTTDTQHAENIRIIQRWANLFPIPLIYRSVLTLVTASVTITVPNQPVFSRLSLDINAGINNAAANQSILLRFNGDTTANYDWNAFQEIATGASTTIGTIADTSATTGFTSSNGVPTHLACTS